MEKISLFVPPGQEADLAPISLWDRIKKKLFFLFCTAFFLPPILSLPAFGAKTTSKPIIIANSATWPPFSFLDSNGQPQGLLIDLWNEWARENNHDVKFKLVDWNESLELIRTEEADIHAGLFKTENRESDMDFSDEKERILQKWIRSEEVLPSWIIPALAIGVVGIIIIGLSFYIYLLNKHKRNFEIQVANRTAELMEKNSDFEKALREIKQLSGLLTICASCKKIRDDKGYWKQIEAYISENSEAKFSHGICPECATELYPELFTKKG